MSQEAVASAESRSRWIWVGAVLVLALGLRLLFLVGMTGSDDLHYATFARQVAAGSFHPSTYFQSLRLGIILPTALGYRLFGVSTATTVWFPVLMSLTGILVVYLLTRELFGEHSATYAAVLYALLPIDVIQSGLLLPDIAVATLCGLALFCLLAAERTEMRRNSAFLFTTAGLLLGWAYLCKESAALGAGILVLYALLTRRRFLHVGLLAAAFAAVLVGEGIYYSSETGDFLFRLHQVRSINWAQEDGALTTQLVSAMEYPRAMFLSSEEFGLFWYLLIAATIWALAARVRKAWVVALWVVPLGLYLQFGVTSVRPLGFIAHVPRYLTMVTIPAAALIGAFLASFRHRFRGLLLAFVFAGVVLASLFCMGLHYALTESRPHNSRSVARELAELPRHPTYVVTHRGLIEHLAGYGNYDLRDLYQRNPQTHDYVVAQPIEALRGSYVVVDYGLVSFERERWQLKFPEYLERVPHSWIKRAEIHEDFSGLRYLPLRLVRWTLERDLLPGPIAGKFRRTLNRIMENRDCVIYEVPASIAPSGERP